MRSFLTSFALAAALLVGGPALAQSYHNPAGHLHAKLDLPRGWHQQFGKGKAVPGQGYQVHFYNPTTQAHAGLSIVRTEIIKPYGACSGSASTVEHHGGLLTETFDDYQGTFCGFLWYFRQHAGATISRYYDFEDGWTIILEVVYDSVQNFNAYGENDVTTFVNSLELQRFMTI